MCRQTLRYRYTYAESTEMLFVESTYSLEHILRLVSGIQEHTDKIALLSSAQFGLVMVQFLFFKTIFVDMNSSLYKSNVHIKCGY